MVSCIYKFKDFVSDIVSSLFALAIVSMLYLFFVLALLTPVILLIATVYVAVYFFSQL